MNDTKVFFNENNRLNKGYIGESDAKEVGPTPAEMIAINRDPELLAKMLELAERDLKMQHELQLVQLQAKNSAIRMGRFFALAVFVIMCVTIVHLNEISMVSAVVFAALGFGVIGKVSQWSYSNNNKPHHPRTRHHNQRHSVVAENNGTQAESKELTPGKRNEFQQPRRRRK